MQRLDFQNKTVFVGEKNPLKCGFLANPMPQATIAVNGENKSSAVISSTQGEYSWKVVYMNTSKWKLQDAGKYSCTVFYGTSLVKTLAYATVASKNFGNRTFKLT